MKCSESIERLDELIAGELPADEARRVAEHVEACLSCSEHRRQLGATVSLLQRAGMEPLPDGFAASLHRRLAVAGRPLVARAGWLERLGIVSGGRARSLAWAGAGAAAALFAVGGITLERARFHASDAPLASSSQHRSVAEKDATAGPVTPTFAVPSHRLAMVKIDFVADEAVDDVEFALVLPEGLHFVSNGEELSEREFRWRGRLAAGSNLIPVAVRGAAPGRYTLAASAEGGGQTARHEVVIEVTS